MVGMVMTQPSIALYTELQKVMIYKIIALVEHNLRCLPTKFQVPYSFLKVIFSHICPEKFQYFLSFLSLSYCIVGTVMVASTDLFTTSNILLPYTQNHMKDRDV